MKAPFSVLKRAHLWILTAIGVCVISWILFVFNAQFSEEFTGGVNIVFSGSLSEEGLDEDLNVYLGSHGFEGVKIGLDEGDNKTKIKINGDLGDDVRVSKLSVIVPEYLVEQGLIDSTDQIVEQAIIGPSVGKYMRTTATQALGFGIFAMVVYMIFSFGAIRKYIAPSILAAVVVLSSLVSISVPAGAYGVWMGIDPTIQIDTVFIIAILTIIGYGINDTIIVFDRIRENMIKSSGKKKISYVEIFENSIWETMKRSIGTSVSTVLVLVAMFVFGTGVIQRFAFTVGIGIIASFLASLFVSVSTAYVLGKFTQKK